MGSADEVRINDNLKSRWFEIIVGKSMPADDRPKSFGFVTTYDDKHKRCLYELLQSQGLQFNQNITFLSDGGDTVRCLQLYLSPQAEHLLGWFHITMRITVMRQIAKGVPTLEQGYLTAEKADRHLESIKWYLWHGNVYMALSRLDLLIGYLECFCDEDGRWNKLFQKVQEFTTYIGNSQSFIPNYG